MAALCKAAKEYHTLDTTTSEGLDQKLADIFQRFEETRQAIKDNVRMLESIQDTSLEEDEDGEALTYRRTISNNSQGSMSDMAGTGTSVNMRTISSIDSGVAMTMASSTSENDLRSRSMSLSSWCGTGSRFVASVYQTESEGEDVAEQQQDGDCDNSSISPQESPCKKEILKDEIEEESSDDEESVFTDRDIGSPTASEQISYSDQRIYSDLYHIQSSPQLLQQGQRSNLEGQLSSEHEYEEIIPDELCPPPSAQRKVKPFEKELTLEYQIFSFNNVSSVVLTPTNSSPDTSWDSESSKRAIVQKCIVLPPAEKHYSVSSSRHSSISVQSDDETADDGVWTERDHLRIGGRAQRPYSLGLPENLPPPVQNTNSQDRRPSDDFCLVFSPIPEEDPSQLTPCSPPRYIQQDRRRPSGASNLLGISPRASSPEAKGKQKKIRQKRKRRLLKPPNKESVSSSASDSSSPGSSESCCYCNGLENSDSVHANRHNSQSSTTSSDMFVQPHHCPSSSSSSSDDASVVQSPLKAQILSVAPSRGPMVKRNNSKKLAPPVMRKVSKDKGRGYSVGGPITSTPKQATREKSLFIKNGSPSLSLSQVKVANGKGPVAKTKSDEASNSILRYFSFPSPPPNKASAGPAARAPAPADSSTDSASVISDKAVLKADPSKVSQLPTSPLARPQRMPIESVITRQLPWNISSQNQLKIHVRNDEQAVEPSFSDTESSQCNIDTKTCDEKKQHRKKKASRCGFFSVLFGRHKKEKPQPAPVKRDPRLLLDLQGGEVRVRPQASPAPSSTLLSYSSGYHPALAQRFYPEGSDRQMKNTHKPLDRLYVPGPRGKLLMPAQQHLTHSHSQPVILQQRMTCGNHREFYYSPSPPILHNKSAPHWPAQHHNYPHQRLQRFVVDDHSTISSLESRSEARLRYIPSAQRAWSVSTASSVAPLSRLYH